MVIIIALNSPDTLNNTNQWYKKCIYNKTK